MFKSLIPWRKKSEFEHPVVSLRERVDDLFDDFFKDFHSPSLWKSSFSQSDFMPKIDISESDKEISISAELPGMTEKDIEVTLEDNMLNIKGEKKHEEEKKEKNYHHIERRYGSFYRSIPISEVVDSEKIDASFKNGVLSIVLPKENTEKDRKRIEVKTK